MKTLTQEQDHAEICPKRQKKVHRSLPVVPFDLIHQEINKF